MAKSAGGVRASKWNNDPYTINGIRKEYYELPKEQQKKIRKLSKDTAKEMYQNLKDKTIRKNAGDKDIEVRFTQKGVEHLSRDGIMVLSGKYMSRESMINIDKIFEKSRYIPNSGELSKNRTDGKMLFFKYEDKTGREIFFKVAYEPKQGEGKKYHLYSVTDK